MKFTTLSLSCLSIGHAATTPSATEPIFDMTMTPMVKARPTRPSAAAIQEIQEFVEIQELVEMMEAMVIMEALEAMVEHEMQEPCVINLKDVAEAVNNPTRLRGAAPIEPATLMAYPLIP